MNKLKEMDGALLNKLFLDGPVNPPHFNWLLYHKSSIAKIFKHDEV